MGLNDRGVGGGLLVTLAASRIGLFCLKSTPGWNNDLGICLGSGRETEILC